MTTEKELNSNKTSNSKIQKISRLNNIEWVISPIILLVLVILFYMTNTRTRNGHSFGDPLTLKQKAQYNSIYVALELFNSDFKTFPSSDGLDPTGKPYCGAMKLAEAFMGQDLMGFHPDSVFRSDGRDSNGILLYDTNSPNFDLRIRKGPYLPIENANAYKLKDIFENTGPFDGNEYLICDIFVKKRHTGKKTGMPVLYYKADTSKTSHDVNNPDNPENIYNYKDNHDLLSLGIQGQPSMKHPLCEDPTLFYIMTNNNNTMQSKPYRANTYILLSAGKDGLYGTEDDIANFEFRLKTPKK